MDREDLYYKLLVNHARTFTIDGLEREVASYEKYLRTSRGVFQRIQDFFSYERDQYFVNRCILEEKRKGLIVSLNSFLK
jgi:hypothetical protein